MRPIETESACYAVIKVRTVERSEECFPIKYHDEEALRALIADSSIVACGIASRERAFAVAKDRFSVGKNANRLPHTGICGSVKPKCRRNDNKEEQAERTLGLENTWKAVHDWTQRAVVATIIVAYSNNVFCGLLRSLIGA